MIWPVTILDLAIELSTNARNWYGKNWSRALPEIVRALSTKIQHNEK
jgi:hypothetical protein